MAKATDGITAGGLPVVTLPISDKGRLIDERKQSRCLSLKWCLLTVCCIFLLVAVVITVLLNWGTPAISDTNDITRETIGQQSSTAMPLRTQIPAPQVQQMAPTRNPNAPGGKTTDQRPGNTTTQHAPRRTHRVFFILFRRHHRQPTSTPRPPLPTSPARYLLPTPHGGYRPSYHGFNHPPSGLTYRRHGTVPGQHSYHFGLPANGTQLSANRAHFLSLVALLRRLHARQHHVTSRDLHQSETDDVRNEPDGAGTAGRDRREADKGRRHATGRRQVTWPNRLENINN